MWSQDFKEFIASLNEHGVEYLVVGGYAVGLHGYPRYTGDLDVWVRASDENATRLLAALDHFGFSGAGIVREDFTSADRVIQLGRPPFRIDLMTSIDGVHFDDCYRNRVAIEYEGVQTMFIGLADLKTNKRASGRPKDRIDLDELDRDDPESP